MKDEISAHFVTFYSPGTFVAETTTKPIANWDVSAATAMAADITERYGARPYGFRFTTRSRGPDDLDSKEASSSNFYYIGCRRMTLEEIESRADPRDAILLNNMRCNGWKEVVTTKSGWVWTQPLYPGDVVLENPDA